MRDEVVIPINDKESLVITTDNSGAIGMKEQDVVQVAYETVGYFSFRVAMMECLAARATPVAVVIQNFCGESEWNLLVSGVRNGLTELGMENVTITGSTESNFPLVQSVVGINVIGLRSNEDGNPGVTNQKIALVGLPLVGDEVIVQSESVAPLSVFYQLSKLKGVIVWPVGSKGVWHELQRMKPELRGEFSSSEIDLYKSGGPSTSFLVAYSPEKEREVKERSGDFFHPLI